MRYFMDTEFIEDGVTIDLISIGIVCEDGREFYAVSSEANYVKANANAWVRYNVLNQLPHHHLRNGHRWVLANENPSVMPRAEIKKRLLDFIADTGVLHGENHPYIKPEFWAYYADYDWVVFCQLFGTMMDLPPGFPMFCMDIKQFAVMSGNPRLPEQGAGKHNALEDARWNKVAFDFLIKHNSEE